jgi:hypothetical protein
MDHRSVPLPPTLVACKLTALRLWLSEAVDPSPSRDVVVPRYVYYTFDYNITMDVYRVD